jgi:hypothetical protein
MSWYIGTLEEVEAYNQKVNEAKQYKGSITSNWANPRSHPLKNIYAILVHWTIEADEESGLTWAADLTDDWFANAED